MYEHRSERLLPRGAFVRRQALHLAVAFGVTLAAIAIGTIGYHIFEGYGWLDSAYAAAMILTGMGPIGPLQHDSAKVFVSIYAIFSGVVFLTTAGITLGPAVHRVLHRLHMESSRGEQ